MGVITRLTTTSHEHMMTSEPTSEYCRFDYWDGEQRFRSDLEKIGSLCINAHTMWRVDAVSGLSSNEKLGSLVDSGWEAQ